MVPWTMLSLPIMWAKQFCFNWWRNNTYRKMRCCGLTSYGKFCASYVEPPRIVNQETFEFLPF